MPAKSFDKITLEERNAIMIAAQEEKNRKIQEAIKNGAKVNYMTSRMSQEEWETHISMTNNGVCIIDTTIPKDITTCLKCGWKINAITYYKDTDTIAGMVFDGTNKNITIRNIK